VHAGHKQAGKSRRVEAEWPTYRAGSSKEEKKETSNVEYSMNKTSWSRSDDTIRTGYKDIDDIKCHGVLCSICI
jgi:hypothetical protein